MPKQDKLPTLDPCKRGIFDEILAAVAEVRKQRKSETWRLEQQRIEFADKRRREGKEIERKAEEARRVLAEHAAYKREQPPPEPEPFIQYRDEKGTLVLKESGMPKFVR